jgi:hypothetical protein
MAAVDTTGFVPEVFDNTWGVFDSANLPVFDVDTCVEVGLDDSSKVSDFPVEQGGFVDYNKVVQPQHFKLRLAVGGRTRCALFLEALRAEKNGVFLRNIVLPEISYLNVTLEKYDWKRTASSGQNMIIAETSWKEIREVTPQYATVALPAAKVKNPASASKPDTGKQQEQDPDGVSHSLKGLTLKQVEAQFNKERGLE